MKWIGKNSTSDASLADITSVVAGTGLSGGGTRGSVTLNVDASIPEITTLAGLTSIGTISTGVWGATDIGIAHGGTGASTFSTGAVLIGNGTGSLVPTTPLQYFNDGAESNTSTLSILSNQDSGDKFTIATTTHGATTLTTIDDDAAAAHFEIAADGDITLDAAGQIYFEAVTSRFVSSDANDPLVIIQGEADDDTGPRLRFNKKRGADGEDGDSCGILQWQSFDDGTPSTQLYGQIETTIHDATAGEESGKMELGVANEDGGMGTGLMLQGGSADNEVDVTIGLGASSVTTVAGSITMSGSGSPVAAMTNAGLLSVANQSNITGVGTITSGVWQGTTIKTAYIGDDQVTEDKLANTLLAEIDANTAKATNVTTNLTATTHASQITINSSDGTNVIVAEASGSIAGVMSVTHHDKLDAIEASATADQSKSDIDGLAITTVGTIDTGVWNGTAIASDQQKHLAHYEIVGTSDGDGTNFKIPVDMFNNKGPYNHTIANGSDGLTALTVQNQLRGGGHVMPRTAVLKSWKGWASGSGAGGSAGDISIMLLKVTPANSSSSSVVPVKLDTIVFESAGNGTSFEIDQQSFTQANITAGDIIISAIKTENSGQDVFFTTTLEVEF